MRTFAFAILTLALLSACQSSNSPEKILPSDIRKVVVLEVIQVKEYTYLEVLENEIEKWLAVPAIQAKKGDTYYIKNGMKMSNFESKELGRTFTSIYFVDKISRDPDFKDLLTTKPQNAITLEKVTMQNISDRATKPIIEKKEVRITSAPEGRTTIAELYKNKQQLANKTIKIHGQVTKVNPAIMKRNWIHLQDGSDYNGDFDLTITTIMEVRVGDVVTVEGKVSLDKDFGAGYKYKLILEGAVLVK